MSVKFQDYYQTLGVARSASADEVRRAYRKLARKHHPDVDKSADATQTFARINEAYEVLGDPEKRKRYDELGENWRAGQEFRPPPGFEEMFRRHGGAPRGEPGGGGAGAGGSHFGRHQGPGGGSSFHFEFRPGAGGGRGFSDFFDMLFGQTGPGGGGAGGAGGFEADELFERMRHGHGPHGGAPPGPSAAESEHEVAISLAEAYHGTHRRLDVQGPSGRKSIDVKIPAGSTDGSRIRLRGQGLVLRIRVEPDDRFTPDGADLVTDLPIAPWEAVLGARVDLATLDGAVTITIPPGTSSGGRLRLRGKGLPARAGQAESRRGDLIVRLRIVVPDQPTDAERKAYESLRDHSSFRPRNPANPNP